MTKYLDFHKRFYKDSMRRSVAEILFNVRSREHAIPIKSTSTGSGTLGAHVNISA